MTTSTGAGSLSKIVLLKWDGWWYVSNLSFGLSANACRLHQLMPRSWGWRCRKFTNRHTFTQVHAMLHTYFFFFFFLRSLLNLLNFFSKDFFSKDTDWKSPNIKNLFVAVYLSSWFGRFSLNYKTGDCNVVHRDQFKQLCASVSP